MAGPIRILILEDSEADTQLVLDEVRRCGHQAAPECVDSIDNLLSALDRQNWDILIADPMMPKCPPEEVAKILEEKGLDLPFILLCDGREQAAVEAFRAGADDCIPKRDLTRLLPSIERVLSEVTGRKARWRAETLARSSDAIKQAILDSAIDAIITITHEGKIIEFNSAAVRMFGFKRPDVIGQTLTDAIVPPAFRDRHRHGLTRFLSTGQSHMLSRRVEMTALRADGTEFPVEMTVTHVHLDGPALFTAFIRDLSERKEVEKALMQMAAIVESTDDAVIGETLNGTIVSWNPGAERIHGYSADEMKGRSISILVPHDRPNEAPGMLERIKRGERIARYQTVRVRKDGQQIQVSLTVSPIKDAHGRIIGASTIARDITERKQAEQELAHLASFPEQSPSPIVETDREWNVTYANLMAAVWFPDLNTRKLEHPFFEGLDAAAAELDRSPGKVVIREVKIGGSYYQQAIRSIHDGKGLRIYATDISQHKQLDEHLFQAQKMEAIGQLAGGIAHHFNNILGGVKGFSDLMLMRLEPGDPLHRFAEQIKNGSDRVAALTHQLLAFSRNVPRQPRVLDLNAVVAAQEKTVRSLVRDHVRVEIVAGKDLGRVKADPVQIEQLIVNLVTNAHDAMPEGGTLTIETADVTLDEDYARQHPEATTGQHVMLGIGDTGGGMTDEVKAHLFEPFFTTKELNKGTGLGLATCYAIVRQSGGHIAVSSEVGRGTVVRIFLPQV